MGVLVIRCPNKNKDISTGVEVSPGEMCKLPNVRTFTQCPRCGMVHSWTMADARLSNDDEILHQSDATGVASLPDAHQLDI